MKTICFVCLLMIMIGIFLAICGASWNPYTGTGGAPWLALIGGIMIVIGGFGAALTGETA